MKEASGVVLTESRREHTKEESQKCCSKTVQLFEEDMEKDFWVTSEVFWQTVQHLRRFHKLCWGMWWKAHVEKLHNPVVMPSFKEFVPEIFGVLASISVDKVAIVVRKLHNSKAAGGGWYSDRDIEGSWGGSWIFYSLNMGNEMNVRYNVLGKAFLSIYRSKNSSLIGGRRLNVITKLIWIQSYSRSPFEYSSLSTHIYSLFSECAYLFLFLSWGGQHVQSAKILYYIS